MQFEFDTTDPFFVDFYFVIIIKVDRIFKRIVDIPSTTQNPLSEIHLGLPAGGCFCASAEAQTTVTIRAARSILKICFMTYNFNG